MREFGPAGPEGRGEPFFSAPWREGSAALAPDPLEAVHAYMLALDRVLMHADELGPDGARQGLDAVPAPAGLVTDHLLERKRRQLLEHFSLAHFQHLHLPEVALEAWLTFFFAAAEMTGSPAVVVDWHTPPAGFLGREAVDVADGGGFRRALRQTGGRLEGLRELSLQGGKLPFHATLDATHGWLALGGPPWSLREVLRELDRLTQRAPAGIAVAYEIGRELQEGATLLVRVEVSNHSSDVLVLEDLVTDHAGDRPERFIHASLGRLCRDEQTDRYLYDAVASGVTEASFRTAILPPGNQRTVVMTLELLEGGESWKHFTLRYQRLDPQAFARAAYVPLPNPPGVFPPRVHYGPIAELARPSAADTTNVLMAGTPSQLACTSWAVPFHVGRRSFSLAQARQRLGEHGIAVHFSRWQQAWVFKLSTGCALVSPGRVTQFPHVDPRAFALIDDSEQRVPVRFSPKLLPVFRSLPLGVTDWENHGLGLSVSLPKLKLTSFFQELERLAAPLGLEENVLGRRTLHVGA